MFEKEFESEPLKAKLGGILLERELLEAKIAILDDGHPYLANSVATDPSNSADAGIVPAKRRFN